MVKIKLEYLGRNGKLIMSHMTISRINAYGELYLVQEVIGCLD
jgi:hypothetical protein